MKYSIQLIRIFETKESFLYLLTCHSLAQTLFWRLTANNPGNCIWPYFRLVSILFWRLKISCTVGLGAMDELIELLSINYYQPVGLWVTNVPYSAQYYCFVFVFVLIFELENPWVRGKWLWSWVVGRVVFQWPFTIQLLIKNGRKQWGTMFFWWIFRHAVFTF